MNVLVAPAHYILNDLSQSEFYAATKVVLGLVKKYPEHTFHIICGRYEVAERYPNAYIYEIFPNEKDLEISLFKRIVFYFKITTISFQIMTKNKIDIFWNHLPNGPYSINPFVALGLDKMLNKNSTSIIGRLQFTRLTDLQTIKQQGNILTMKKNTPLELISIKIISFFAKHIAKLYYKMYDRYIFNNQASLDFYKETVGLDPKKINYKLIPVGIDHDLFKFRKKELTFPINILFAGQLTKNKRVDKMLEVCKYLNDNKFKFVLNIVGDGDELSVLEKYIKDNNLKDIVIFHGRQEHSNMGKFYDTAHILFMFSKSESFGQVMVECFASGTLFMCSKLPVFTDVIEYGKNGYIFDLEEEDATYKIAQQIMNIKPEEYNSIISLGYEISKKYRWDYIIEQYGNVIFEQNKRK